jgi:hypothetical protein
MNPFGHSGEVISQIGNGGGLHGDSISIMPSRHRRLA